MRYAGLFLIITFLFFQSCSQARNNTVNFSGTWIFDKDRSEAGERPEGRRGGMVPVRMIVKQESNKLVVESFRLNREAEEVSFIETFTLDGSESENETRNRTSISTIEWLDNGQVLRISSETNIFRGERDFTMQSETTWSIKDDALILESIRSTPRGERESKMVFIKSTE